MVICMKKRLLVVFAACIGILCGCSKNENETTVEIITTQVSFSEIEIDNAEVGNVVDDSNDLIQDDVTIVLDYENEKEFESALNAGEDTIGKTVKFKVDDINPESSFGYDLWAGEHLNFVSDNAVSVNIGDELTVKIDSVENVVGSWIIHYTVQ